MINLSILSMLRFTVAIPNNSNDASHLVRGIGFVAATALIVTSAIGTGVFLKARVMICNVGTPEMGYSYKRKEP